MTNEKFLEFTKQQRDFYEDVEQLLTDDVSLQMETARQSQIIAALVLENGGKVSHESWDRANASGEFIPHGLSQGKEGAVISVTLPAETTT